MIGGSFKQFLFFTPWEMIEFDLRIFLQIPHAQCMVT